MDVRKPATDTYLRAAGKICPNVLIAQTGNPHRIGVGESINYGNCPKVRGAWGKQQLFRLPYTVRHTHSLTT